MLVEHRVERGAGGFGDMQEIEALHVFVDSAGRAYLVNGVVYLQMQSTITAIPNPDVFFIHVPKTAGTSLRSLLEQYHDRSSVAPSDIIKRLAKEQGVERSFITRTPELDAYTCFHAHTNYVDFLRDDLSRVTILRDPMARLNSLMNHWRQWTDKEITKGPGKDHIKDIKKQAKKLDLGDFLEKFDSNAVLRLFHNGMTKNLVSNFPVSDHLKLKDQRLVAQAISNLDRMDWVGITERFDESILLLCDYFAWPVPNATQRLNVRQHRTKETDEPTQSIKDALEYDQVIYARGVELLDTRLDELRARFEHLVTDQHDLAYCLSAENTKRWLAQTDSARPTEISRTMDEPLRGIGWHEREGVDTGRTPRRTSRWTGPGTESTIECLVKPADAYRVELGVESVIDQDIYRGVAISINGQESQAIDFDRSWVSWISGKPPRTLSTIVSGQPVGDDGFCRLKIQVPRTISQEQISPGCADKRAKGIGICSYHIEVM